MINVIKGLVKSGRICVLSTVSGDRPYCSLMRYICDDPCTEIYLVTHRSTTKYQNLMSNPHVSLLMDTREKEDLSEVRALTVEGCFAPINDPQAEDALRRRFIDRHPDLKAFAEDPDAELLRIEIDSFLLLNGLQDAHYIRLKP